MMKWKWTYTPFRIAFGLIFIWASWDKLFDPHAFARVIYNYKLLPPMLINPIAIILPWLEMCCGVLLVIGVMPRGSLLILNGMLLVFAFALGVALYRGLDITCGCFSLGQEGRKVAWSTLGMDVVLLFFGIFLASVEYRKQRK